MNSFSREAIIPSEILVTLDANVAPLAGAELKKDEAVQGNANTTLIAKNDSGCCVPCLRISSKKS